MGYIRDNLLPGEHIVYETRLHWTLFLSAMLFIILGLVVGGLTIWAGRTGWWLLGGGMIVFWGLLLFVRNWTTYQSTEFGVTNRRVIVKQGLWRRQTTEMLLHQVEVVSVRESLAGRLMKFGSLEMTGAGGTHEVFHRVHDPFTFRRQIQDRIVQERDANTHSPARDASQPDRV